MFLDFVLIIFIKTNSLQRKNTEFGRKTAFTEILQSAVRMLKKMYLEFTEILQ